MRKPVEMEMLNTHRKTITDNELRKRKAIHTRDNVKLLLDAGEGTLTREMNEQQEETQEVNITPTEASVIYLLLRA